GFIFEYPEYGPYIIHMEVFDVNANNAIQRRPIQIKETTGFVVHMLSVPNPDRTNQVPEIFVGKNLDNTVLFYVYYTNPQGICYVDIDIKTDSENKGNPEQNKDFFCNQLHLQTYIPNYYSITGRIYYEHQEKLQFQDFIVSFLDFDFSLDEKHKEIYTILIEVLSSPNLKT
ncbi:MAG: hypothetical protein NZM44_01605, partial [Candidatus Calescibacterium sp.]|nr:hypothetical protein [Candidatus Calescibacterium sp.]